MGLKYGLALVFTTAIISGLSIFVNSIGVKGFDSSVFTFSKNLIVAILLFCIIFGLGQYRKLVNLSKKEWGWLVLIGFVGGSIPFLLFFRGLQLTTGSTSAFIHKTMIIYVLIFALLFLKEKANSGLIIGVVLILIGNFFMISPNFNFSVGHLMVFGATILWGLENTISKYVLKNLSGNIVAFGRMFFGSIFILTFLALTGKINMIFSMNTEQYGWIILTGVLLLGFVITYYNGLAHIKVTSAVSILALGSPITTILSFGFNGGAISVYQGIGIIILILGVVIILWLQKILNHISTGDERVET